MEWILRIWHGLQNRLLLLVGILIFIAGIITTPLPTPIGVPLMFLGSLIMIRNSRWAKKKYIQLRLYVRHHRLPVAEIFAKFEETILRKRARKRKTVPIQPSSKEHP